MALPYAAATQRRLVASTSKREIAVYTISKFWQGEMQSLSNRLSAPTGLGACAAVEQQNGSVLLQQTQLTLRAVQEQGP